MRNSKEQTYRLPILVLAANSYIVGREGKYYEAVMGHDEDEFDNDEGDFLNYSFKYQELNKIKNSIKIPRSSYYRVINQLSKEGYLQKRNHSYNQKVPYILITLNGLRHVTRLIGKYNNCLS